MALEQYAEPGAPKKKNEDISAPRCFEIERRLIEALDCPVMHDDQHGTAIVVLAVMMGATKVLDRASPRSAL